MKIWKDTDHFTFRNPVLTIGVFDGVHLGHRYVIDKINNLARSYNGESVVLTLWPHPRLVLNKNTENLKYLSSYNEKILLLEKSGIDHLIVVEFTKEFSQLGSCEFIKTFLVEKIGIRHLVIGYNHKFGKNREGDLRNLYDCAQMYNFSIDQAEEFKNGGEMISSSLIRELLLQGRLELSNRYLGYDYFLQGKVTEGNHIGRKIGFPTANVIPDDKHKLIPRDGVYAVSLEVNNKIREGMLNIGIRPTIDHRGNSKTIEVHIFDFEGDLYGKDVTIYFRRRIRDEQKFENIEQLRKQLVKDMEEAKRLRGSDKGQVTSDK